jgi:tetratricopeptide (TPR) repeat protein
LLAAGAAVSSSSAAEKSQAEIAADKAYQALVAGKSVEAITLYSEAIESRELKPEQLANALLNRALAYQNKGQHADAVDDYSAALRVDAMGARLRAVALYNRGIAYQKLEKPAQAIEDFTNALFLDVEFAQAYYSRGNVLRESGQYLFALSDYEKALKYNHPEPHLPLYGTALTYEELNRPEVAQKSLVQALAMKPDFQAARLKLSNMLKEGQPADQRPVVKAPGTSSSNLHAGADAIVTGSVDDKSADLVMRKKKLPVPVSPPSALMAKTSLDTDVKVRKPKIVARIEIDEPPAPKSQDAVIEPANAPPPEKLKLAKPKLEGWTVQLSSQKNEDAAWKFWKTIQTKHAGLLQSKDAMVVEADLGAKGIFYRLRVHKLESKKSANRLCKSLKRRGTACFVSRAKS